MPVQEMLIQLKEKYGHKYGWCVISAEDHEERENDANVGVHRHVMIECCKNFETENCKWWDLKYQDKVFHPHFEPVKNKVKCLQYTIKDDDYIVDGTYKELPFSIETYLEANGSKKQGYGFTYIANEIKKGKTLYELDDVIPGHVLNHKRKIEEYINFQEEKKLAQIKMPTFPGFLIEDRMPYDWKRIAEWANENFLKPRAPRQPQLWIWSREPEMGKTYPWAIIMRNYFKCYEWVYGNKQDKSILNADYILLDELKGGITVGELKSLSQMYGMNLDIKYGSITHWGKNVPLIVTSNRPPREIYTKQPNEEMVSLESRFFVINIDEPYHLKVKEPEELSQSTTNALLGSPQVLVPATPDIEFENKEDLSEHSEDSENSEPSEYELMLRLSEKNDSVKKNSKNLKNSKK